MFFDGQIVYMYRSTPSNVWFCIIYVHKSFNYSRCECYDSHCTHLYFLLPLWTNYKIAFNYIWINLTNLGFNFIHVMVLLNFFLSLVFKGFGKLFHKKELILFLFPFLSFAGIFFFIQFFCSSVKAKLVEIETESENTFLKRHLQTTGIPQNGKYIYWIII